MRKRISILDLLRVLFRLLRARLQTHVARIDF
jgi:hypothetical protein